MVATASVVSGCDQRAERTEPGGVASIARVLAARRTSALPDSDEAVRTHCLFLARAVSLMTHAGIRQFVDLASGPAFVDTLRRAVRRAGETFRLICVDPDEVTVTQYEQQLSADAFAGAVDADLRSADQVFSNRRVSALLDLTAPIGLVACAVDDRLGPDAHNVMHSYVERLPGESHILVSQLSPTTHPDQDAALTGVAETSGAPQRLTGRNPASIERMFTALELLYPGIVDLGQWRPDTLAPPGGIELIDLRFIGGVGRKPATSPPGLSGDVPRATCLNCPGRNTHGSAQ